MPLDLMVEIMFGLSFTLRLSLKVKMDGTAWSFSTRLLQSLKHIFVKCCEQMLLYFVGLKLSLPIAITHFSQTSGRVKGNLKVQTEKRKPVNKYLNQEQLDGILNIKRGFVCLYTHYMKIPFFCRICFNNTSSTWGWKKWQIQHICRLK